jgi:hypothetical protein
LSPFPRFDNRVDSNFSLSALGLILRLGCQSVDHVYLFHALSLLKINFFHDVVKLLEAVLIGLLSRFYPESLPVSVHQNTWIATLVHEELVDLLKFLHTIDWEGIPRGLIRSAQNVGSLSNVLFLNLTLHLLEAKVLLRGRRLSDHASSEIVALFTKWLDLTSSVALKRCISLLVVTKIVGISLEGVCYINSFSHKIRLDVSRAAEALRS